ncbi:hypothetical protein ACFLXE_05445 [Chloroflexota bacterium]
MSKEPTDSEKLDQAWRMVHDMHMTFFGDPKMRGVKGLVERIFNQFDSLPCKDHTKRLNRLETAKTVNNAVRTERRRLRDGARKWGLPAGVVTIIIGLIEYYSR